MARAQRGVFWFTDALTPAQLIELAQRTERGTATKQQGDEQQTTESHPALWIISAVSGLMLAIHIFLKFHYGELKGGLDAVAVGLIAFGLSPWIARILESFKFGGVEFKFVKQQVEIQREEINALKFLITRFISRFELQHLEKFSSKTDFTIDREFYAEDFKRDLEHMRGLGLIKNYPDRGIRTLYGEPGRYKNVHDFFYITDAGKTYLKMRANMSDKEAQGP